MTSLLDQSALADLAERLVAAARRAGADAADAVAMRGVSLSVDVRDGGVEESQRAEGDDVGLRVLVGRKQAVVSTNDVNGEGLDTLAERAVAMARAAPEDRFAGLADPSLLARQFPELDLLDPDLASVEVLEKRAREAEEAALAVTGVTKSGGASASSGIGGMVLVTSGGFRGLTLASNHSISMSAIAGNGTGMETDYDFTSTLHASDLESAQQIGRNAGERAVKRLNPRKVATRRVPVLFDTRISGTLVGHLASAANGSAIARKTSFLKEKRGERIFPVEINIIDDPLRKRGLRSRPFDAEGVGARVQKVVEDGVLKTWFLDSATARELNMTTTGHAQRGVSSTPSPGPSNLELRRPAAQKSAGTDRRNRGWFFRHQPDRHGCSQHGHRRLQPRRLRFLDRKRRADLSGERSDHRRAFAGHLQKSDAGERPRVSLRHQRADLASGGSDCCRSLRSSIWSAPPSGWLSACAKPAHWRCRC